MIWKPIDRILNIDFSRRNPRKFLLGICQRLLDPELNDRIKSSAADKISRVINVCLTGGEALGLEDEGDDKTGAKAALQDALYEKVILELETDYKGVM
jgi:hypothetical protein